MWELGTILHEKLYNNVIHFYEEISEKNIFNSHPTVQIAENGMYLAEWTHT